VGGTLRLAIPSIVLGFILGIFIGIGRLAPQRWIRIPATLYVEFFRGIPLVMVIFWMWFIIPIVLNQAIPEYWVALTAFVIFEAAYLGEIVRAGIQSVPRGQVEASRALGLSALETMLRIVLPQAIKNMIPALVGQFISLFKDTSLAVIIGLTELVGTGRALLAITTYLHDVREVYVFLIVVYFVFSFAMSKASRGFEQRLGLGER